jgi:RNA polymerase sigma-70 factor (ECF subfamily)
MNRADFELILREQQAMVYSIAYHFFHNVALAEEVAQDVFLQLYENRNSVDSPAHAASWLRRAVTHRCIDALRHKSLRSELQFEELPDISDDVRETDPLLEERLRRLVASLPEKLRIVVVLRYGEDMDVEDISRTLEVPVRTVWSNLQRAMALMRSKASRYLKEVTNGPIR